MKQLDYIKKELSKIENNESSFLGIDGGNINAQVWFCGVEFGSDLEQMEDYYNNYVKTKKIEGYNIPYRVDCSEKFLKSIYDRFLTTIYINLFKNERITIPVNTTLLEDVLKKELYNETSKIFKLNLYPLAKKDTSWDKAIVTDLGIEKRTYYGRIFENRKFFLKKLAHKFEPKLIICTSPKGFEDKFIESFLDNNQSIDYSWDYLSIDAKRTFKISVYDNGKTKVIIIPFLGRGNLSSYADVIEMTNYLRIKYYKSL